MNFFIYFQLIFIMINYNKSIEIKHVIYGIFNTLYTEYSVTPYINHFEPLLLYVNVMANFFAQDWSLKCNIYITYDLLKKL